MTSDPNCSDINIFAPSRSPFVRFSFPILTLSTPGQQMHYLSVASSQCTKILAMIYSVIPTFYNWGPIKIYDTRGRTACSTCLDLNITRINFGSILSPLPPYICIYISWYIQIWSGIRFPWQHIVPTLALYIRTYIRGYIQIWTKKFALDFLSKLSPYIRM